MRGVGFVILFLARRWVCCRLFLRVRAVLGLREVGVLGLEREGIVRGGGFGFEADRTFVSLTAGEVAARQLWFRCRDPGIALGEVVEVF